MPLCGQPGSPVPSTPLPNVAGGTLSLRSNDGQPTVLVVFGSWCAKTSTARFVGIDELESTADAKAFVEAEGVPFPTVSITSPEFSGPGITDEQRGKTGIDIPAIYVVDASGKSYRSFVGTEAQDIAGIRAALLELAHASAPHRRRG